MERLLICAPLFVVHAASRHIGLNADDRLDPALVGLLNELDAPVERAVVGDGDRVHPEALRLIEERGDLPHTIEQAVLAMDVEMGEVNRAAHGGKSSGDVGSPYGRARTSEDAGGD